MFIAENSLKSVIGNVFDFLIEFGFLEQTAVEKGDIPISRCLLLALDGKTLEEEGSKTAPIERVTIASARLKESR